MADTKKAETKNQHYVPKFYQRFFSPDTKTIGTFNLKDKKYFPEAPIKNQSKGDYFYSENQKIEDALSGLEGLAADVFKKIIANPKGPLTSDDQLTAYVFTFMQIGRTLDKVNMLEETADVNLKNILKKHVELLRKSDDPSEVEMLTDEVMKDINIKLHQGGKFSLGTHATLINTCADLKMKVLINNTKIPFITSDNPACMYSMFLERVGDPTYALASKGLIFYLPLTPNIGLMFYDSSCYKVGDRKKKYVEITQEKDIENLNTLSASYANKTLYCLNGSMTVYNMEKLAISHDKFKPSKRVDLIEGIKTDKGEIIATQINSIYCKLNLQFMKEIASSKAITSKNYNRIKHGRRTTAGN